MFKPMMSSLWGLLLVGGCTQFEKPLGHELRNIHGWIVAIDHRLLDDETGARALALLEKELRFISEKIPVRYAKKLQAIPIYLDKSHGQLKGEMYHPDLQWLIDHHYDPSLWRCVQVPRAVEFCDRGRREKEPHPLLHQLIHGFQDQAFGFKDPRIVAGYERFKAGRSGKHPALIRPREYFLEMSLAYFNIGRVPPKTAEALKRDDAETYRLIEDCWQRNGK
jgi:hypothetical protein